MFFTEYILALIKVLFNLAFCIVTAIPLRICWNCVATNYLAEWLPDKFEIIPYWHLVAILFVLGRIQEYLPKLINVSQSNENKK